MEQVLRPVFINIDMIAATIAHWLFWLAITLFFLISPMVLFHWGFNYEDVGGSPFEKIHPGSFVAVLALIFQLIAFGFTRYAGAVLRQNTGLVVFITSTAFLMFYAIIVQKLPFTPIIDTFGLPIIVFMLIVGLPRSNLNSYAHFLHVFFAANALLAVYEYVTGNRLTPFVAGTLQVEADWRATALLGHPLINAALTGVYILLLSSKGAAGLTQFLRAAMLILQLAAMVAFGARASLVTMLSMMALIALKNLGNLLAGNMRISLPFLGVVACALPVLGLALFQLDQIGFFDRLLARFVEDRGSASARIAMLQVFDYLNWRDILWGPDPAVIETLKGVEGIETGIESIWVAFILTYGALMSALFFAGLFAFCVNVARRTCGFSYYIFIFYFLVASTSVSLSAKTTSFGMLIIMLFVFLEAKQQTSSLND